jgi:hypothetical protein
MVIFRHVPIALTSVRLTLTQVTISCARLRVARELVWVKDTPVQGARARGWLTPSSLTVAPQQFTVR